VRKAIHRTEQNLKYLRRLIVRSMDMGLAATPPRIWSTRSIVGDVLAGWYAPMHLGEISGERGHREWMLNRTLRKLFFSDQNNGL